MKKNITNQNIELDKLKIFLKKLFQFESQDLDFGVYKILNQKKKEINHFINELLINEVEKGLNLLSEQRKKQLKRNIAALEEKESIKAWLKAKQESDDVTKKVLEKTFASDIVKYNKLDSELKTVKVDSDTQKHIYNQIFNFFSRYYDKGDFVSKKRYSRRSKYMIPYNGEETYFYWANHDQYYIKSSEAFQQYSFQLKNESNATTLLNVHFKLAEVTTTVQGNVKENDPKFFRLHEQEAELDEKNKSFTIFFEYRQLGDVEKKALGNRDIQKKLNLQAAEQLKQKWQNHILTNKLWETEQRQELLFKKLTHYTKRNNYDFFVHKDLAAFLKQELDFFIKNEMLVVDDLYSSETEAYFDSIKQHFRKIKVFKNISDTIIDFLSQIENFQKKLWEKKKFVIYTEWVISVDKLIEFVGLENAMPILKDAVANKKQKQEWLQFFGTDYVPEKKMTIQHLKDTLHDWKKLSIDTKYFDKDFRQTLLNTLSEHINICEKSNGLVLHTDNFHGLNLLQKQFKEKIKCIYIDPPYNTGSDSFLYKDGFSRSSWLSFMQSRLSKSKAMLLNNGLLFSSIDDNENYRLREVLNSEFSQDNYLYELIWHLGTGTQAGHFTRSHEYIEVYAKNKNQVDNFNSIEGGIIKHGALKKISKANPASKILFKANTITFEGKNAIFTGEIGGSEKQIIHGKMIFKDGVLKEDVVIEAGWAMKKQILSWLDGKDTFDSKGQKVLGFYFNKQGILWYRKERTKINPPTVLSKISNTKQGTSELINFFPQKVDFPFPKPSKLIQYLAQLITTKQDIILDYFAGSGTSFHATQLLNNSDAGNRKCILIEQGDYVHTAIIPRIKKVAFSFDWKNGLPQNTNGDGIFFQYQRLEQYEESLENIRFNKDLSENTQLKAFADYVPKYMLDFETQGSPSLVDVSALENPYGYRLKVWDGYTYDTVRAVDVVATFNYLIGLHIEKYFFKIFEGIAYTIVIGHTNDGKKTLVIWRNIESWAAAKFETDSKNITAFLADKTYDKLYINGQASGIENYTIIENVFARLMAE